MSIFPIALTYTGWAALCLSMSRHAREVLKRELPPVQRHLLRTAGWSALAASLSLVTTRVGWPIGTVQWFGMLTASAVSFVLLLSYYPRLAAGLGLVLPMFAALVHAMWSI